MAIANSSRDSRSKPDKSRKPAACPLWLHPSGRWCKKIRQRVYYFGKDLDAALLGWAVEKDDLLSGRTPAAREVTEDPDKNPDLRRLCDRFLTARKMKVDAGEVSLIHFRDLKIACSFLLKEVGGNRKAADVRPVDFEQLRDVLCRRYGLSARDRMTVNIRSVFNYAVKSDLLDRA